MKKSKRNANNVAAKTAKRAGGKPAVSKYAEKGPSYKYGFDMPKPRKGR